MHSQEKTQKLSGKMATCAIFVSLASSWGDRWTEHVKRYATHHLLVRERYFIILSFVFCCCSTKQTFVFISTVLILCLFILSVFSVFFYAYVTDIVQSRIKRWMVKKHKEYKRNLLLFDMLLMWKVWIRWILEFSHHSTEDFITFQLFVLVVMPAALSKTPQNHNISENKLLKK